MKDFLVVVNLRTLNFIIFHFRSIRIFFQNRPCVLLFKSIASHRVPKSSLSFLCTSIIELSS